VTSLFSFCFFPFFFFKGNRSDNIKNIVSKEVMNKEHKAAQIAVLDCTRHYAEVYKGLF